MSVFLCLNLNLGISASSYVQTTVLVAVLVTAAAVVVEVVLALTVRVLVEVVSTPSLQVTNRCWVNDRGTFTMSFFAGEAARTLPAWLSRHPYQIVHAASE